MGERRERAPRGTRGAEEPADESEAEQGKQQPCPCERSEQGTAVATAETRACSRGETEARAERADKRPDCGGGGRERPKGAADHQQHCDHREQCY